MRTYDGLFSEMRPLPAWTHWPMVRAYLRMLETGDTLTATLVDHYDRERRAKGVPSIFTPLPKNELSDEQRAAHKALLMSYRARRANDEMLPYRVLMKKMFRRGNDLTIVGAWT